MVDDVRKFTPENLADFHYAVLAKDGRVWAVPLNALAEKRAEELVSWGEYADQQTAIREEIVPMLNQDTFDLVDYIKNNTDIDDFKEVATCLGTLKLEHSSRDEAWVNGPYQIFRRAEDFQRYFSSKDLEIY